ncbi:MAG: DeoR/GlpR family DNA-binding transcription regulator [Actinobacteria bacterium]|nr:DeoR/GlpR family DNA-binding transcription regulator [Actinomycetota bacterium]
MEENNNQNNLSKIERQRIILNLLSDKTSVTLVELENYIECSRITIQRDLVELENKGFLNRVHGGATLKNFDLANYGHDKRLLIQSDKKKMIAKKVISLIKPDMYVFLDASSTSYFVSEHIFPDNVRVVTSGIDTFINLQKNKNIKVVLTGGRINPLNRTLVGPEAISTIKQFHFNIAFFSADSIIKNKGVYSSDKEAAAVAIAGIEHSNKRILLFDSSKVHISGGAKVCDLDVVDNIVTDDVENPYVLNLFEGRIL